MYIEDFDTLVKMLKDSKEKKEKYLDKLRGVDSNISFAEIISDNEYSYIDYSVNIELMRFVFGDMFDHVDWYLYEWKPGYKIEDKGVINIINNYTDFLETTKQMYQLPMKPVL